LKDHGGASDDYRKTLQHLTAVYAVLLELENFSSSVGTLTQINAIRGQAQLIQKDVEQFLKKIKKYKNTLGARGGQNLYRGILPKIEWSQHIVGHVKILARRVEIQLSNIHVLLGLHQK
jgi:hypothetical protein